MPQPQSTGSPLRSRHLNANEDSREIILASVRKKEGGHIDYRILRLNMGKWIATTDEARFVFRHPAVSATEIATRKNTPWTPVPLTTLNTVCFSTYSGVLSDLCSVIRVNGQGLENCEITAVYSRYPGVGIYTPYYVISNSHLDTP